MKTAERPQAVIWFEALSVAMLGIETIFSSGLSWSDLLWVPLTLWIVWSISRRKSVIARWIFTAFYVLGFALLVFLLWGGSISVAEVPLGGWLLTAASIAPLAFLWAPATSQWMASAVEIK